MVTYVTVQIVLCYYVISLVGEAVYLITLDTLEWVQIYAYYGMWQNLWSNEIKGIE